MSSRLDKALKGPAKRKATSSKSAPSGKKQKRSEESDEEGEEVVDKMEGIDGDIKKFGKLFGLTIPQMESCQTAKEYYEEDNVLENNSTRFTLFSNAVQLHNSQRNAEAVTSLNEKSDKVSRVLAQGAQGKKGDLPSLTGDQKTKLHRYTFITFLSGVVSQWHKDSKQIEELIWEILSKDNFKSLSKVVGGTRINSFKDGTGKAEIFKVIRREIARIRNRFTEQLFISAGLDDLDGTENDILTLPQLATELVGKRGVTVTKEMCYRIAYFRYCVRSLEGQVKVTKKDKDGLDYEVYANRDGFWQEVGLLLKMKREEAEKDYPNNKSEADKVIKKFLETCYEDDAAEWPFDSEESHFQDQDDEADEVVTAAATVSGARGAS